MSKKTKAQLEEQIEALKEELLDAREEAKEDVENAEGERDEAAADLEILLDALDMCEHDFDMLRRKFELDPRGTLKRWLAEKGV